MLRGFVRRLGFAIISVSTMYTPLLAYADDGNPFMGAVLGVPIGAVATGVILVSMSSNKSKATKAAKYVKGELQLKEREDIFLRTETTKEKVGD